MASNSLTNNPTRISRSRKIGITHFEQTPQMPSAHPQPSHDANHQRRHRRSHKKSRRGCAGCKHRRVKCDEAKPCCKKCRSFGLQCSYDSKSADELTFAGEGCFRLEVVSDRLGEGRRSSAFDAFGSKALRSLSPAAPLSQAAAIVGHLNGLPSPPGSGDEGGAALLVETSSIADLQILARFNERTVLSVGTRQAAKIYQREVFQLACTVGTAFHLLGVYIRKFPC